MNGATGLKGDVHDEEAVKSNRYNQNFRNRFCGCAQLYDATLEKGTMFQCLGLATEEEGDVVRTGGTQNALLGWIGAGTSRYRGTG